MMSDTKRDYYEILGVSKTATDKEVEKAFRRLAKKSHPDIDRTSGAHDRFEELNEAHQVLSDPEKRANYDRFGFGQPTTSEGASRKPEGHQGTSPFDYPNIFGESIFSPFFSQYSAKPTDYFKFPANDLGLLAALMEAYKSREDGKWEVKKSPADTREEIKSKIYIVLKRGGDIQIYRWVDEWRQSWDKGKPMKEMFTGETHDPNNFISEPCLTDGYHAISGLDAPIFYGNYLNAMRWLAFKLTKSPEKDGKYDAEQAIEINRMGDQYENRSNRHDNRREQVVTVPYANFWNVLEGARNLVEQTEGRVKTEGRIKFGKEGSESAAGEKKG